MIAGQPPRRCLPTRCLPLKMLLVTTTLPYIFQMSHGLLAHPMTIHPTPARPPTMIPFPLRSCSVLRSREGVMHHRLPTPIHSIYSSTPSTSIYLNISRPRTLNRTLPHVTIHPASHLSHCSSSRILAAAPTTARTSYDVLRTSRFTALFGTVKRILNLSFPRIYHFHIPMPLLRTPSTWPLLPTRNSEQTANVRQSRTSTRIKNLNMLIFANSSLLCPSPITQSPSIVSFRILPRSVRFALLPSGSFGINVLAIPATTTSTMPIGMSKVFQNSSTIMPFSNSVLPASSRNSARNLPARILSNALLSRFKVYLSTFLSPASSRRTNNENSTTSDLTVRRPGF